MMLKIFLVCITGSVIGYFDVNYGMVIILSGIIFIILLELWNNKKPPSDSTPLYTDDIGI